MIEVGHIFQKLYEEQRHPEALSSYRALEQLDKKHRLDTRHAEPADALSSVPGTNRDDTRKQTRTVSSGRSIEARKERVSVGNHEGSHRSRNAQTFSICGLSFVTRSAKNIQEDIAKLNKYPALQTLHPKLLAELQRLQPAAKRSVYSVPYAVAYADDLMKAYGLLNEAADAVEKDDEEFARYLRNRARDLLSNDYESGDASWITGRFKNLNAQIGSYETYDDELFGVKTFFSFCLLQTRQEETDGFAAGDERYSGARRFAAIQEPQKSSRRHSGRRLRRGCRLRAIARRKHGHDSSERELSGATLWPHDLAAREYHARSEHLRRNFAKRLQQRWASSRRKS